MKQIQKQLLGCIYTIVIIFCSLSAAEAQTPSVTSATNNTDVYPLKVCDVFSCPSDRFTVNNTPDCLNADAISVKKDGPNYNAPSEFAEPWSNHVNATELWGITYSGINVEAGSNYSGFTLGTYRQFTTLPPTPQDESFAMPLPHPYSMLPEANTPDIALTTIGDPINGYEHIALIVYECEGNIYIEKHQVTIDADGKVTLNGVSVIPCPTPCYYSYQGAKLNNNAPDHCYNPHIDVWHVAGTTANGDPTIGQYFAVTWEYEAPQQSGPPVTQVWGIDGTPDLVTINPDFYIDDGKQPDVVAVSSDPGLVIHRAYVSYLTNSGKTLHANSWDYGGGSLSVPGPTILNSSGPTAANDELATPRISGPMYYDYDNPDPFDPLCVVVVNDNDGNYVNTVIDKVSAYKLYDVSITSPGPLVEKVDISDYDDSSGFSHYNKIAIMPVVTGVGKIASSHVGMNYNPYENYAVEFYSDYAYTGSGGSGVSGDFYAFGIDMDVNVDDPVLNGTDYMEVNYDPLTHGLPTWDLTDRPALAVTTSHNSGNGLLSTYYEGDNTTQIIMTYQDGSTAPYSFKPGRTTGIENADKNGYAVYPNPVNNVLNIAQADGAAYTVTDAVGRTLDAGTLQGDKAQVNTTRLTPGMYIMHISKDGHAEKVKFVKQ